MVNVGVTIGNTTNCTITNTKKSTITIHKETLPDGSAVGFNFSGDIFATLSDGQSSTPVEVAPGTYTVTEQEFADWRPTSITCSDANSIGDTATRTATFHVEVGEDVVCTFTNTLLG